LAQVAYIRVKTSNVKMKYTEEAIITNITKPVVKFLLSKVFKIKLTHFRT